MFILETYKPPCVNIENNHHFKQDTEWMSKVF